MVVGATHPYGEPSGSVAFVSHRVNPQPCLAVRMAMLAPRAVMDSIHCVVLSSFGSNVAGSLVGPLAYLSIRAWCMAMWGVSREERDCLELEIVDRDHVLCFIPCVRRGLAGLERLMT